MKIVVLYNLFSDTSSLLIFHTRFISNVDGALCKIIRLLTYFNIMKYNTAALFADCFLAIHLLSTLRYIKAAMELDNNLFYFKCELSALHYQVHCL